MTRGNVAAKHGYDPVRPFTDAFGRQRVSNPYSLLESQMEYDDQPLIWESVLTNGGTANHSQATSTVSMDVGAQIGSKVVRQTPYFYYHAGKSLALIATFCFNEFVPGVRSRVGYFDDNDGVFLERDDRDGVLFFVLRSGGKDTRVPQTKWNQDCLLEGRGRSGIDLHSDKAQILLLDLQWLGVGRVRFGFDYGEPVPAHFFNHANRVSTTYMRSANLPVRYEIENITGASTASMTQICSTLVSEGGFEGDGFPFGINTLDSLKGSTTLTPILSIRPKLTFQGRANRIFNIMKSVDFYGSDTMAWEVIYNGALTDAVWNDVNSTYSGMEYDSAATDITGGIVIDEGFLGVAGSGRNRAGAGRGLLSKVQLALNAAGDTADILTLVANQVGTSNPNVGGGFSWRELR